MGLAAALERASAEKTDGGKIIAQVLDETGDSRHEWDRHVPGEVDAAREFFDLMKGKGYEAYSVGRGGKRDELVTRFDPAHERYIFHKRTVAG